MPETTAKYVVICPCCEATLTLDAQTGAILSHAEKTKPLASFEAMAQDLGRQKEMREQLFAQEMKAQKDRKRLLDEKFNDAFKNADKSDKPFRNPLDYD